MQYVALKKQIERKKENILNLQATDINVVSGKVKGSSPVHPYIETHMIVQMYEPKESDRIISRIKELRHEIREAEAKIDQIEIFINAIDDVELKEIFELRVYERKCWNDIAAELSTDDEEVKDRTTYSKRFKNYLKKNHK